MKILIYGAGVIGSVYAARIYQAGYDITLLARGTRYETFNKNGIIIRNILNGEDLKVKIPLVQQLHPEDHYDLIIVTVRFDQLESVKERLKENKRSPVCMFMLNNPERLNKLVEEFPDRKILAGFPGIGGTFEGDRIHYVSIKQQKTTFGEVTNLLPEKKHEIKMMFEKAGFQTSLCSDMQSWLITHAVFISCASAAIISENGNSVQLGENKGKIRQMILSIREGFLAIENLHVSIVPSNLKTIFLSMPTWFAVMYWQKAMKGKTGTLALAPHVNAAREEVQFLADKVLAIVHSSSLKTPLLDELLGSIKP